MRPVSAQAAAREQSLREEWANAASHGLGFVLAAASLPTVLDLSTRQGARINATGACVFSATMMLVYFASMVYHALPQGRVKHWFKALDHAAIFLFIAGSCTPFALRGLHAGGTWWPLVLVWALALAGVVVKTSGGSHQPLASTLLYVALGWLAAAAALPVLQHLAAGGLLLVSLGGGAYMVGAVFFLLDGRLRYAHFVWHLFVLAGSSCHFFAALLHAL